MLAPWAAFFTLAGSSAAALTGLMFVVITLVAGTNRRTPNPTGFSTFSTPTVLHFSTALVVSAVLCAPWTGFGIPAWILGLASLYLMIHMGRVIARIAGLEQYRADLEDWVWFNTLPLIAYGGLVVASVMLYWGAGSAPFVFAAGVLLLLVIGIHNAWDVVTYLAIYDNPSADAQKEE